MRLGQKQLELLCAIASPGRYLVVGDKVSSSLEKRGLVSVTIRSAKRTDPHGGGIHITAAGLRALADAAESGQIDLNPGLKAAT